MGSLSSETPSTSTCNSEMFAESEPREENITSQAASQDTPFEYNSDVVAELHEAVRSFYLTG